MPEASGGIGVGSIVQIKESFYFSGEGRRIGHRENTALQEGFRIGCMENTAFSILFS